MLGFINLNKPAGWTSHDCVAKVRRLLKTQKVGHGGTLDPLARGVLPIAVGKATRLLPFFPEKKVYQARIRLGVLTTTDDLEGEILQTCFCPQLSLEEVQFYLNQFIGVIEQIPPLYSAIKKDGKKLYELARKGEKVDVSSRQVEIEKIDILGWYPGDFPEVEVEITCGSGTYIRSIARDLGQSLKVGGTLAHLIRTESCGMKLGNSMILDTLSSQVERGELSLIPVAIALQHLSEIQLSELDSKHWCQGQKILLKLVDGSFNINNLLTQQETWQFIRLHTKQGECLGVGELIQSQADWWLHPKVVLK